MNSTTKFCILATVLFITMLIIHTQIRKSNIYYDKYDCIYKEQLQLLEMNNELYNIIDSLQCTIDSLYTKYQIFDSKPAGDFLDILNAIIQVESRGNPKAHAQSEDAVGILQIRKCMVDDINRILKKRGALLRYTYNDRWDEDKSIEMFDIFCTYYGLNTAEEMARCWNGGPRGINNPRTLHYWNKVENELEEIYALR